MNEIGEKRLGQIREAVDEVETAEFEANLFDGMNPGLKAEVEKQTEARWASLAREHMRWLMLTVMVEQSRADYYEAKTA